MLKYAIMSYIPQRYMRRADFDTQDTMRHLLDFKAGRKYATKWAADLVARTLAPMDLTNTIIVCIPASSCLGKRPEVERRADQQAQVQAFLRKRM